MSAAAVNRSAEFTSLPVMAALMLRALVVLRVSAAGVMVLVVLLAYVTV